VQSPLPASTPPIAPTASPRASVTVTATLAASPPSRSPTPESRVWDVRYLGCESPGANAVKGRVFDREGGIVYGARVFVTLDGWPYDLPAISNEAGWYEFYLDEGLRAQIDRVVIAGEEQPLAGDVDMEFPVRPDCFQRVDLRER